MPPPSTPLWIVTGAAGLLGNNLVRELLSRGHRVRACVREGDPPSALAGLDCETVTLDVTDLGSVTSAFSHPRGLEAWVVHCAGIVSIAGRISSRVREVNVGGTRNVLQACRRTGVNRLAYISSVHAIPEPDPPRLITELDRAADFDPDLVVGEYAKTKAEATASVLAADDLWRVVVHPSGIIGPNDHADTHLTRLVRDASTGRLTSVVRGCYDFVDVRDVVAGTLAAIEHGRNGRTYILSGHRMSVAELVNGILGALGRRRRPTVLPMWFAKLTAPLAEAFYRIRGTAPLYTSYSLYTLESPCDFSHERASAEFGYHPRPMSETLNDTVTWLASNPQHPGLRAPESESSSDPPV